VFWFLFAGPLLLSAWQRGWAQAAVFLAGYFALLVGLRVALAALGGYGREHLGRTWRRRLSKAGAVVLVTSGAALMWQAWEGNYGRLIRGGERVEEFVDER